MSFKNVTHSDFDGVVSAALIRQIYGDCDIIFSQPKNKIDPEEIGYKGAIVTDLPALDKTLMHAWYDHHARNVKESIGKDIPKNFRGSRNIKPSCASTIYEHNKKNKNIDRSQNLADLLKETDRIDSGYLTKEDIENPQNYMLLARTISGNIDDKEEMEYNRHLVGLVSEMITNGNGVNQILSDKQVKEKLEIYQSNLDKVKKYIKNNVEIVGKVATVDYSASDDRSLSDNKYRDIPDAITRDDSNYTIRMFPEGDNIIRLKAGYNILKDKSGCDKDIASFLSQYGGGGHARAAGMKLEKDDLETDSEFLKRAYDVKDQIVEYLNG